MSVNYIYLTIKSLMLILGGEGTKGQCIFLQYIILFKRNTKDVHLSGNLGGSNINLHTIVLNEILKFS